MFIKKTSLALAFLLIGFFTLPAMAMPPKPASCPSVSSLKSSEFTYVDHDETGYSVATVNSFGTHDTWLFGIVDIKASSSQDAMNIGYSLLSTLYGSPQPVAITKHNVWGCLYYTTTQGMYGIAVTPLSNGVARYALGSSILHSVI